MGAGAAPGLPIEVLMQTGARSGLELLATDSKLSAKGMRLGKKIGGNMTVMLPPAGMGEAAEKERVAVLPAAPGKRSLLAMVKVTLDIQVMEVEVEVELWIAVTSRNTVQQKATENTLAHILFCTQSTDAMWPLFYLELKKIGETQMSMVARQRPRQLRPFQKCTRCE